MSSPAPIANPAGVCPAEAARLIEGHLARIERRELREALARLDAARASHTRAEDAVYTYAPTDDQKRAINAAERELEKATRAALPLLEAVARQVLDNDPESHEAPSQGAARGCEHLHAAVAAPPLEAALVTPGCAASGKDGTALPR